MVGTECGREKDGREKDEREKRLGGGEISCFLPARFFPPLLPICGDLVIWFF